MFHKAINALIGFGDGTQCSIPMLSDSKITKGVGEFITDRTSGCWYPDLNGVVTYYPPGTPVYTASGQLNEPSSTNRCTCYGVPRADAYGAALASGASLSLGKIYEIVSRTTLDFTTVGAANNTTGTQFIATGTGPLSAGDSAKECIDKVGTKAFYSGAFIQNITGMSLSGDHAAILSIVNDQTELTNAKLNGITNSYKVYDLTTTAAGAASVDISGPMAAVITSMGIDVRVLSGSATLSDSAGSNNVALAGTAFYRANKENFTAIAGRTLRLTLSASSQIRFIVPQVESLPYLTSRMPSTGATATRAATSNTLKSASNVPLTGAWHIPLAYTPDKVAAGRKETLLVSRQDANNYLECWVNGVIFCLEKRTSGVSEYVTFAMNPIVGTTYHIDIYIYSDNMLGLFVDGVSAGSGLGNELATNGDFSTVTGWLISGAGTSIDTINKKAVFNTAVNNENVRNLLFSTVRGKIYNTGFEILSISAGGLATTWAGVLLPTHSTVGIFRDILITASSGTNNALRTIEVTTATATNFTVKEILNSSSNLGIVLGPTLEIGGNVAVGSNIEGSVKNFKIVRR